MQAIQRQFVLSFAVMGAVLAYLPVFLRSRLGDHTQVGLVLSTTGVAIILTPVVMTALADTRFQSRTLIAWCFGFTAAGCALLLLGYTLPALVVIHLLFCFAFWPQPAMQDGLLFAENRQRERNGLLPVAYHKVRVFGSVGFTLPLVLLYVLLDRGLAVDVVLVVGAGLAMLGLANAFTLPHIPFAEARRKDGRRHRDAGGPVPAPLPPREGLGEGRQSDPPQAPGQTQGRPSPQPPPSEQGGGAGTAEVDAASQSEPPASVGRRLDDAPLPHPTRAAAGVLFRGPALVFCIAMFLAHLANAAFYSYYPIYLEAPVGFDAKWIGPITMIGVVIELPVMLAVGWMTHRLGLKGLLLLGLAMMAARLALLGLLPTPAIAVGTQLLHGMTVVAMYVVAPIYLNTLVDHAEARSSVGGGGGDRFRNSMQGLFAMAVFGPARVLGPIAAGALADVSMLTMFNASAGLTVVAMGMLVFGFRVRK